MGSISLSETQKRQELDRLLVEVRAGKTLDQALQSTGRAAWFHGQLTRQERAPVMAAALEQRTSVRLKPTGRT